MKPRKSRIDTLAQEIDAQAGPGLPADRKILQVFFKPAPGEELRFRGVRAPRLKEIARDLYREVKGWPVRDRDELCEKLWKWGDFEGGAIVCYLYRRFEKQCGAREFRLFTRWLDEYVNNWGLTDGLSLWLLGASIENEPSLVKKLLPWTRAKNRWKRRAAAVALVYSAKRGEHTGKIFRVAKPLLADADDMVQKGVGWLLKETYPKKPGEVMQFLMPQRHLVPRLVLRYAAEKMTSQDKTRLLAK
jgi:3-methyladenine DNA glycosylase AlkD